MANNSNRPFKRYLLAYRPALQGLVFRSARNDAFAVAGDAARGISGVYH